MIFEQKFTIFLLTAKMLVHTKLHFGLSIHGDVMIDSFLLNIKLGKM